MRKSRSSGGAFWFTLAMLAVYRVGVFITVPGVNRPR
jgi:preprotein translocase subunit SecY